MLMTSTLRVAIIDDDEHFVALERALVEKNFPDAEITVVSEPVVPPDHNVYLLDNIFGDTECAPEMVAHIRQANPNALIVLWSASLSLPLLKTLTRYGIDAVADKSDLNDLKAVLNVIREFSNRADERPTFFGTIRTIRDLLMHWNRRLEQAESEETVS